MKLLPTIEFLLHKWLVKIKSYKSFILANNETWQISIKIFKTLGELITGQRSIKRSLAVQ